MLRRCRCQRPHRPWVCVKLLRPETLPPWPTPGWGRAVSRRSVPRAEVRRQRCAGERTTIGGRWDRDGQEVTVSTDAGTRGELLERIRARRASIHASLRDLEPRGVRLTNLSIICSAVVTALTAGPALGSSSTS